ncbi:MAG: hypothetical protein ABIP44_04550 [Pseudoxanthomonas sp.]
MKALLSLLALLVLLSVAGWMATRASPDASATTRLAMPGVIDASNPRIDALKGSPQAQAWEERQAFEARARRFMRDASRLGAVERSEQARALSASIDRYESQGGLSAGESLLLRTGLIKATMDDETRQAEQIAALMEDYRQHADQRMDAYATQHAGDPRFQDYKARERAIVAEVMALRDIPGGITRNDYLRQRLQQARESAYR